MTVPDLHGKHVALRQLREEEVPRVVALLEDESVREFWGTLDEARFRAEMLEAGYGVNYAVWLGDTLVGLVYFEEEKHPDYFRVEVDIFMGAEFQNRGLGTDALRTVARYLFEERGHHAIDISPAAHNERAIAAYKKVGFKPQGLSRMAERIDGGPWHDSLRMDMLRDELVEE